MASTSETGHAKNVANFEDLISFCTGYGATYNPSKNNIKLPALNTLFTNAKNSLQTVKTTKTTFDNVTNTRIISFESLKKLSTRIVNALDATDASKQAVNDAKTINRKLQGQRADTKTPTPTPIPNTPIAVAKKISVSQQSYDNLIDNLTKLIQVIASEPLYNPNENDLKVTALNTLLTNLKAVNTTVINATTPYSNARITRDTILYAPETGLVAIAQDVKKYVKSIFGATSPQYKQVTAIQFTTH